MKLDELGKLHMYRNIHLLSAFMRTYTTWRAWKIHFTIRLYICSLFNMDNIVNSHLIVYYQVSLHLMII